MSSFVKGLVEVAIGVVAVAGAILLGPGGIFAASALAHLLGVTAISAIATVGAGLAAAGAGTLISGSGSRSAAGSGGITIATQGGIQDWRYVYGPDIRVGGDLIYKHEWGDSDKFRDEVYAIACHPTQAVRRLLLNNQFVQIDPSDNTSFTPVQQTVHIHTISRTNNVVTVVLDSTSGGGYSGGNIPYLDVGVEIQIQNVSGDHSLNGKFTVESIVSQVAGSPGSVTFTYLCGGTTDTFTNQGQVKTLWPDYGRKVYMEVLDGTQTATFNGMLYGTGYDGDLTNIVNDGSNPWTADCVGYGHTLVFLRWHYNDTYFAGGMPTVAFIVDGKNNIYDPRTGTRGFTGNAALCAADWAADTECGMGYAYHTEIPDAPLIAAANICDETVALAGGGTTPRYVCAGQFTTATLPGTTFLSMLTACAGHYTEPGGQLIIWPAAWRGASSVSLEDMGQYSGPFDWSPKPNPRELYNGVKGTYYSPSNRWQLSDFPAYAQDLTHGYNIGVTALAAYNGDANLRDDQDQRLYLDIHLPFTPYSEMCQRIAKIELERRRAFGVGTFRFNMSVFSVLPMDIVPMTNPVLGWTDKTLQVNAKRFGLTKQTNADSGDEAMAMGIELDLVSTSASVYYWDPNEALTPEGYRASTLPTNTFPETPQPPSQIQNFQLTSGYPTYDTQNVYLQGTGDLPVALNGFAGGKILNVLAGDFDHPVPLGDFPYQAGDTQWKWAITEPIPGVDQAWQLYAQAYGISSTGTVVYGPWLPVTSPTTNETPHFTVNISSQVPGNLTSPSAVTVDTADPLVAKVSGTLLPPSPLKQFDGCQLWVQDITGGVVDGYHDFGLELWDGTTNFSYKIPVDRLTSAHTYQLWFVPHNQVIGSETLNPTLDASVTFTVPARTTTSAPLPPTPGTLTATITLNPGPQDKWGFDYSVGAPSGGWAGTDQLDIDIIQYDSTFSTIVSTGTPASVRDFPSGSLAVTGSIKPLFLRPNAGASNEYYKVRAVPKNSTGDAGTPVYSANLTLVAGGSATPPNNIVSITATGVTDGSLWGATLAFVLPANYPYLSAMDMFIRGPLAIGTVNVTGTGTTVTSVSGDQFQTSWPAGWPITVNGVDTHVASVASTTSLTLASAVPTGSGVAYMASIVQTDGYIGTIGNYQFNSTSFTFDVGVAFQRPSSGSERYFVFAPVWPGIGPPVANPTKSNVFTISPPNPAGSGLFVTGQTASTPGTPKRTVDGTVHATATVNWTNPVNTDVDWVIINAQDPSGSQTLFNKYQIHDGEYGTAQTFTGELPAYGAYTFYFYSQLKSTGALATGSPPSATTTPNSGTPGILPSRFGSGTFGAALTFGSTGSINMPTGSTGGAFLINYDPATGFKVTSVVNNMYTLLQAGMAQVFGTSGLAGSYNTLYSFQLYTVSKFGNVAIFSAGGTTSGAGGPPFLSLYNATSGYTCNMDMDPSTGFTLDTGSAPNSSISMLGANSLINLNGSYQANGVVGLNSSARLQAVSGGNAVVGSITLGGVTFDGYTKHDVIISGTLTTKKLPWFN